MKNRNVAELTKNAMGTVFLLAGAFFVCSTFLSIRAVFADPIAPMNQGVAMPQAQRAGTSSPRANVASPRGNSSTTVSRGTATTSTVSPSRTVAARTMVSRGTSANTVAATGGTVVSSARPSMASSGRTVVSRGVTSRGTATSGANVARTVVARTATTGATSAANTARVSLQGSAIRGSKLNSNTYTYLSSKLYTGNYSNIIDPTTGLISADAYSNCLESYYACMDEICTARNATQGRCACAGRVKAFAEAETALETANEELIEVSGQLALLIATKGKDVSAAFQLTDAEKVMNCVSWRDVTGQYGQDSDEAQEWCKNHGFYDDNYSGEGKKPCGEPDYCKAGGNNFGFNLDDLEGSGSDILAKLQSWADAKENTITILTKDNDNLTSAFDTLTGVVGDLAGVTGSLSSSGDLKDSLAETWGYELFEYAHNNVCARVLDSCFNGIYEACGTPPNGVKCYNGAAQCPYNYNSQITVAKDGTEYNLKFITPNSGYSASNSAACFGYTSTTGDPYSDLRGPVADARRSIMQKYALDANAACDVYGEQLSTTAQNIAYQKVAAQQALQQKRLEFAQEEQASIASNYSSARNNFNECLSELYDCYTTQESSNPSWSTSRIKTYCAQVSNVPHCYDTMICGAPNSNLQAVIDVTDTKSCTNSTEYGKNTCRNIVTLSEILSDSYAVGFEDGYTCEVKTAGSASSGGTASETCISIYMREQCLQNIGIEGVRNWARSSGDQDTGWSATTCPAGQHLENNSCVPDTKTCVHDDQNAATAQMTWISTTQSWSGCQITSCKSGYTLTKGACVAN